jgi:hypothetical protein
MALAWVLNAYLRSLHRIFGNFQSAQEDQSLREGTTYGDASNLELFL